MCDFELTEEYLNTNTNYLLWIHKEIRNKIKYIAASLGCSMKEVFIDSFNFTCKNNTITTNIKKDRKKNSEDVRFLLRSDKRFQIKLKQKSAETGFTIKELLINSVIVKYYKAFN